ncbi:MAG TPA: hypothetical protein VGC54_04195, partial [Planctomycetota bacterium]
MVAIFDRRRVRGTAALILALAPLQEPRAEAPWSDLEPVLAGARAVVLAEVMRVARVGDVGLQVGVDVKEILHGRLADQNRRPPRSLDYLAAADALARVGDVELLFLDPPGPTGRHFRVVAKIDGRDRDREQKLAWLREILRLRATPATARGRAHVRFYLNALASADRWTRWRGLRELQRLRRERPAALRSAASV